MIWLDDDITNWSRWSLSYFGITCDIVSVLSSNHFSSQQLNNKPTNSLLLHLNMPMTNSRTFQSASSLNTITRPTPKRSGGDYPSGQQVCCNKFGLLLMKTDLLRFRSMIWFSQIFLYSKSSRPWGWTTTFGCKPSSIMKNLRGSGGRSRPILTNDSCGESSGWG